MEHWEALMTTVKVILVICGAIASIAAAAAAVIKVFAPLKELKVKVEHLERELARKEDEHAAFREAIKTIEETEKQVCCVLLEMLDHEITGNHIDGLKKTRKQLYTFISDNHFDNHFK